MCVYTTGFSFHQPPPLSGYHWFWPKVRCGEIRSQTTRLSSDLLDHTVKPDAYSIFFFPETLNHGDGSKRTLYIQRCGTKSHTPTYTPGFDTVSVNQIHLRRNGHPGDLVLGILPNAPRTRNHVTITQAFNPQNKTSREYPVTVLNLYLLVCMFFRKLQRRLESKRAT